MSLPLERAYLTDGKRLAQFIGMNKDGDYVLEDCSVPYGYAPVDIVVKGDELTTKWQTPQAFAHRRFPLAA